MIFSRSSHDLRILMPIGFPCAFCAPFRNRKNKNAPTQTATSRRPHVRDVRRPGRGRCDRGHRSRCRPHSPLAASDVRRRPDEDDVQSRSRTVENGIRGLIKWDSPHLWSNSTGSSDLQTGVLLFGFHQKGADRWNIYLGRVSQNKYIEDFR